MKSNVSRSRRGFVVASLVLAGGLAVHDASAAPPVGGGRGGPRGGPPPEAFAACEGLAAGDACTVDLGGSSVDGTCRSGPDGQGALACAAAGGPGGGPGQGPPEEAIAACDGLAENDSCAVTLGGNTMSGRCELGPDGQGTLACAPDRPEPPDRPRR